jgi:hypothetical protein
MPTFVRPLPERALFLDKQYGFNNYSLIHIAPPYSQDICERLFFSEQ